jgi:hypothetical protein
LDWNPQEAKRGERLKKRWEKEKFGEAGKCGKTCSEVKGWQALQSGEETSQMPYVANGTQGYTTAAATTTTTTTTSTTTTATIK